jgi:hypothetical protein
VINIFEKILKTIATSDLISAQVRTAPVEPRGTRKKLTLLTAETELKLPSSKRPTNPVSEEVAFQALLFEKNENENITQIDSDLSRRLANFFSCIREHEQEQVLNTPKKPSLGWELWEERGGGNDLEWPRQKTWDERGTKNQ